MADELKEQRTVRSTRLIERQSRKRGAPKPTHQLQETNHSGRPDVRKKVSGPIDLNDPLRMFLWGPETKQLLTVKEESELIVKIQVLFPSFSVPVEIFFTNKKGVKSISGHVSDFHEITRSEASASDSVCS